MGKKWWEEDDDFSYNNSKSNNKKSSNTSTAGLHSNVKKASDKMVEEIKEGDPILPWLFGAAGMIITYAGKNFGDAFTEIIHRGWPSE